MLLSIIHITYNSINLFYIFIPVYVPSNGYNIKIVLNYTDILIFKVHLQYIIGVYTA